MSSADDTRFVVIKFGGTSVSSRSSWDTIASIATNHVKNGYKPLIVCSALSGVSNALEKLLLKSVEGNYDEVMESIRKKYQDLAVEMEVSFDDLLTEDFDELKQFALGASLISEVSPRLHAKILAFGELMSTKLGAAYLNTQGINTAWIDARDHLKSIDIPGLADERQYLSATCSCKYNEDLSDNFDKQSSAVLLTQGFIASDFDGETVLLGRGGSDTSAAYFAAKIAAERCEIWTDVPGIFSANPHLIPAAKLIKSLDYTEAQEITSSGAKVLHPRCIRPLEASDIPLYVKCTHKPEMEGTVISSEPHESKALVKVVSSRSGVKLVSMEAVEMWQQSGFLADAFAVFKKYGVSIDLVSTSETNVTASLDSATTGMDAHTIKGCLSELSQFCKVKTIDNCALVSIVGQNIRTIMHKLGPALEIFEENKLHLVSLSSSDLNFSFVVDEDQSERLVRKLHDLLIHKDVAEDQFGPSWQKLFDKEQINEVSGDTAWWRKKQTELIERAQNESPLFVYNEESILDSIEKVKAISNVDQYFYAIKANSNKGVVETLEKNGINFECVSIGEVEYLLDLFPDMDRSRILFTPNFAEKVEYAKGLELGIMVTLDNLYPMQAWPEMFADKEVFIRLDPGQGRGHHKHVHTAGAHSKFGVYEDQLQELVELTEKYNTHVVGLHAHTGSGIRTPYNWREEALFLAKMAKNFPEVRVLDLGGGLGVPEKPGQKKLDVLAVNETLTEIKQIYPDYELWIEPGRFMVAHAGVILAKVTQFKQKAEFNYVGINVGMNSLIRPALYGAFHEIVNLSKANNKKNLVANIVGPICESGDTFGYSRRIATPDEGDIMLIATAGAYGRVMSSSYNMRPPAKEVFLKK